MPLDAARALASSFAAMSVLALFERDEGPPPPWREQLRQAQIASLYSNIYLGMTATWFAALALVWLLFEQGVATAEVATIWFALVTLLTLSRLVLAWFYARAPDARTDWRKWGFWFTAGATSSGFVWGFGLILMMTPDRLDLQLMVVMLLSGIVYGSLAAFGRWMPAFFGFYLPSMVPGAIWSLAQGDTVHVVAGLLAAIWIPAMTVLALRVYRDAEAAMTLGFENQALAENLRRQKQVADQANAAKSSFLAAASHDLRQPVHALGLFVGALRAEKGLSPGATRVVEQIDHTVDSLDTLFTSLLDVSRLDAGVVSAEIGAVALQPLLTRIAAEATPEAQAKGLRMRLHAPALWVRSDPVLLERIVRNLVSNAVRHTRRGGVLIAARPVAGAVKIEVWDTGPGIAESERERVFEEFVQLDNQQRAREGGMGLGLSIVRRLCRLLEHPMELVSTPGRGSVFRITAPRTEAVTVVASAPAQLAPVGGELCIWVIDDDVAARNGMESLLASWGYSVVAAASSAELLSMPAPPRADVILSDYRLAGEDGIDAIGRLRAALGASVPAALITGDTGPDRLREAAASGLPLVHKPTPKPRLRALISNLARARLKASES
ncbi:hybrid sensor histidine kinase/response regulator [Terricaulis sp.]|uniref:hybrid sensor histidine kinase/response regulator n=1 Tax=Terricaulis sp. TaxID=2768686 RepID=UPI003782D739